MLDRKYLRLCGLIAIMSCFNIVYGQTTNLEFITEIVDSTAESISINKTKSNKVFVKRIIEEEPLRDFLVQRFEQQLVRRKFKIQFNDSAACDLYLKFYIDKAFVKYIDIKYSGLFKSKKIQRQALLSYQINLVDIKTGQIILSKSEQISKFDWFDAREFSKVEKNRSIIGLIKKPVQKKTGWLEYFSVASIFIVIGYLLYIVRSR